SPYFYTFPYTTLFRSSSQFKNLGITHCCDQVCNFAANAQSKNGCCLISTNHLLCQHQVTQIGIPNFSNDVVIRHDLPLVLECLRSEEHTSELQSRENL